MLRVFLCVFMFAFIQSWASIDFQSDGSVFDGYGSRANHSIRGVLDFDGGDAERSNLDPAVKDVSLMLADEDIYIERIGETFNIRFPIKKYFKGRSINMWDDYTTQSLRELTQFIIKYVQGPVYIKGLYVKNPKLRYNQRALIQGQVAELIDFMWDLNMVASAVFTTAESVHKNNKLHFWRQNWLDTSFIEIKFKARPGVLPQEFEN